MSTKTNAHVTPGLDQFTWAGVLISIGIVFGDIGTSPLYTYKAIIQGRTVDEMLALGGVSAIFWTLTFQTTLKYIFITLRADNQGEGGIFSLYTLIRRYAKWLMIPAIVGGSFLLADSLITPPISVSSAIEGLRAIQPDVPVIPIVLTIVVLLFAIQRAGSAVLGNLFGPAMLIWFTMIGVLGAAELLAHPDVIRALNPVYAYRMIVNEPEGFWLLGGVFLCTTGAEALYSDMGHCGRRNIQVSWIYVKICLVLCYLGQASWLMQHLGKPLRGQSPFFGLVPGWFLLPSIGVATVATVIASQALISGSFTLVNEAMRLNFWPKLRVLFPTNSRGQLYIPALNFLLLLGCCGVVLYFREAANMEAAFGLSVTLTMLMTTVLLGFYLLSRRVPPLLVGLLLLVFLSVEGAFLAANLRKFSHGGWVTFVIGAVLVGLMYVWNQATMLKRRLNTYVDLRGYLSLLTELSKDETVPKYATNLVYLTSSANPNQIEERIIHSIFFRQPKRADNYWFVHIDTLDEPYRTAFAVQPFAKNDVYRLDFRLGFRELPRLNLLFRKAVEQLVEAGEIDIQSRYASLGKYNLAGDFRFVVIERFLSVENELSFKNKLVLNLYFLLRRFSLTDEQEYGLETSSVTVEKVPLIVTPPQGITLVREA
jgi:KUP system potassium uptake protein